MIIESATSYFFTHLGILISGEKSGKVIGMPTSEVYADPHLIHQLLQVPKHHLDNGIQAQIYAGPEDTLVVFYPHVDEKLAASLSQNLKVNSSIWNDLTGINIHPKKTLLAFDSCEKMPELKVLNIELRKGSLLEACIEKSADSQQSLVGFIFSSGFQQSLQNKIPLPAGLALLAAQTDFLMNKNSAMPFLKAAGLSTANTYIFNRSKFSLSQLKGLETQEYVFKPAGGAAGLGLFPKGNTGANTALLKKHLADLEQQGTLPANFQIQEFIPGPVWGVSGLFLPGKKWKILQVHSQCIDERGRFTGGRWCLSFQREKLAFAESLFSKLSEYEPFEYTGLIEFDLVGETIIEVNPRITASSPIGHLLSLENRIKARLGTDFRINQLDINTQVQFPRLSGKLRSVERLVKKTKSETGMLTLPQGINPMGASRVLFVNDQEDSHYQRLFLKQLEQI
ncbi:ATP-grasp domain-containing protein [Algoriphagus aestuariicola]|uniref:ATP-grasp domain-containing protein n=1 Tax=Algoriphagus aestuariicola TaxID=1852016 RepID=A0ABS3BPC7_9BACT|nr:ATP-grasp domain-containing protein [Algoriphagus aestuariicola]MBN7801163.1 ATP-grasp domain-containing protein [Algoriphagus aestuariicola]